MTTINKNICFIDFETTGSNLFKDYPIQFGALLYDENSGVVEEFESLIRPRCFVQITKAAFQIHGISKKELLGVSSQKDVLDKFFSAFGYNYCFAGWNISFDIPFFRKMCYENGYQNVYNVIDYRHLDIQSMCRLLTNVNLIDSNLVSLNDYASYFNLNRSEKHDALEDAKITYKIYLEVVKLLKAKITTKS